MKLADIASFVKSANAGASQLTFDIGFPDEGTYRRVVASGAVSAPAVAALYRLAPGVVQIYSYDPALIIKITIPRPAASGGIDERDFDGTQQFAPLLDLELNV